MVRPHRFTAVLDACVLYPAPVRDLLLSFAAAGVCGARWIVGRTDAIITFNLKDFPDTCTSVHGIKILHPDDFIVAQYLREPAKILSIISGLRARLKKPSVPADSLLSTYERQGLPKMSNLLRTRIDLI